MTISIDREKLKQLFLELLRDDSQFRDSIVVSLSDYFTTRAETNALLNEIKLLRSDFNKGMSSFENSMEDLRSDFNKRMSLFEKAMEDLRSDFNKQILDLRNDFNKEMLELRRYIDKRFHAFEIRLSALGSRWGLENEAAIRNAIRGLYEERFKVKVKKWEYFDEEGVVFNYPSIIKVDLAITNGEHTLIEIKSHVRKSDITELLRIAELYEKVEKTKPHLIIITPFIEEKALEFAKIKHITVYSSNDMFDFDTD